MRLDEDKFLIRFKTLDSKRVLWLNHWQEIGDYVVPRKDDITQRSAPGEKKGERLFDTTAQHSCELLSGALHGLATNPTTQWFQLTTGDADLDEQDDVRLWLQKVSRRMMNLFNNSNFQTEVHEFYLDLCSFGTGTFVIEKDEEKVIRFSARHIREIFIGENSKGLVDELFRRVEMDARQLVEMFGEENLPKEVIDSFKDSKKQDNEFKVIHGIYKDFKNETQFEYVSQWLIEEHPKQFIREGGFDEFPFAVTRWTKGTGEIYGRSPAMKALPDIKMINKMEEVMIKSAAKTMDPPLQAPDDGYIMPLDTTPGAINFFRAGSSDRIQPIFNDARVDFGERHTERTRERIRKSFFIDQLQLNEGPQMTATEVIQRTEERLRLLAPMMGRLQFEFLRPLINRTFAIMLERGLIPREEIPEVLSGRDIDVEFSSMIAMAQRSNDANNFVRFLQMAQPLLSVDPSIIDMVNASQALKISARAFNVDQRIIRNEQEVAQRAAQRAQAQQQILEAQQQQQSAETQATQAQALERISNAA